MKKAIGVLLVGAVAMSLCASAFAEEATISTTPNEGGLTSVQDSNETHGSLGLVGVSGDTCRADITDGNKVEIPIDKPDDTGAVGLEVQIVKGGEYIDNVSIKNDHLVVTVKNPGTLTQPVEYTVYVTLYDMTSGQPSKFYVTGIIGASSSSKPDEDGNSSSKPDGDSGSSSKPGDNNSSKPDDNSQSKPDTISRISLKGAENGVVHANLFKYGGGDEAEIAIEIPEGAGTIRLENRDIIDGSNVIRKVSVKGNKLVIEGKFPADLLEPEDYTIDVTLGSSKSGDQETFRIEGTVYWQDSYGPVSPDEYREKKYVIVDFDGNEGDPIDFKNGCLLTDGLKSGIANLDVSYTASSNVDADGLDVYTVNFTANPRLDRNVTVCLDADDGDCVYEVKNGKLVQIDAKYNKSNGELRFESKRLGEYVVTEKAISDEKSEKTEKPENPSNKKETDTKDSSDKSSTQSGNHSPEQETEHSTNRDQGGKTVPNTGRYSKPNPNTGGY